MLVKVFVGSVMVLGTVPENTVCAAGVDVLVITISSVFVSVIVDVGPGTNTIEFDANSVMVVVRGPSGPSRLTSARRRSLAAARPRATGAVAVATWTEAVLLLFALIELDGITLGLPLLTSILGVGVVQ